MKILEKISKVKRLQSENQQLKEKISKRDGMIVYLNEVISKNGRLADKLHNRYQHDPKKEE